MDANKELADSIDIFAREVVATAKGNTYINARLDLITRIRNVQAGEATPDILAMTESAVDVKRIHNSLIHG